MTAIQKTHFHTAAQDVLGPDRIDLSQQPVGDQCKVAREIIDSVVMFKLIKI
jgi:hypothetical protein